MPCSVASAGARVASGLLWQAAQAFSYTALPGCSPAASAAAVECDQVSISAAIPNAAFHIVATAHIYCSPSMLLLESGDAAPAHKICWQLLVAGFSGAADGHTSCI